MQPRAWCARRRDSVSVKESERLKGWFIVGMIRPLKTIGLQENVGEGGGGEDETALSVKEGVVEVIVQYWYYTATQGDRFTGEGREGVGGGEGGIQAGRKLTGCGVGLFSL